MRRKSVIFVLLSVMLLTMAGNGNFVSLSGGKDADTVVAEKSVPESIKVLRDSALSVALKDSTLRDSTLKDSVVLDSLELAIREHNKAVDDSIYADSLNRAKSKGIDSPVKYTASDSIVYYAGRKQAYLYGSTKVKYGNMDLDAEKVRMNLDSSMVHATGIADTAGVLSGTPIFKMGSDTYESDTMAFNFKTKRGLISNVYTKQEDGFLKSERSKRDSTGFMYLRHGRYTTCDEEHPDFYIALSRAKVRPGKDVTFGPAYLVVADVPLPIAIPYGFFPFTKSYSSGFIMPTYGDESTRGFYLRDGGYYFAMSDKWDLKLLGEIFTKGSWGLSAASNYNKRYRHNGSFYFSYQSTKTGDKGIDEDKRESIKLQWSHRQDAKANPFNTFSASVNFASVSYERNNLTSLYNPQAMTQSTRTSSVNWTTTFSSLNMTVSGGSNITQNMRDSSLAVTLPDLNVNVSRFYPFKRKQASAKERWYEKISVSYTGELKNSIETKENKLLKSNLVKDWKNGMQHTIPVSASFTVLKYLTLTPNFTLTDRMYTNKVMRSWDDAKQVEKRDTTYGFYNVYNWRMGIDATTKIYGFYIPSRKIFGDKIQAVRHVFTPKVGFSYAPDFGAARYGYHDSYVKTDADGTVSIVEYSPYSTGVFSPPGKGKTGLIDMSISNNIEMKVLSDKDSTGMKKISIIDELGARMSYNTAAEVRPWSDLTMNLRLKWWKSYTFNMTAVFATYAYDLDEKGNPYVGTHTEYSRGRFGRFQGMSQNFSFTLNPEKLRKLFGGGGGEEVTENNKRNTSVNETESNIDDKMEEGKNGARKKPGKAETDADGYMRYSIPWSLTIGYGITMRENTSGTFNKEKMRYPYKYTQNVNFSGNIRISDGWNISFSSGYDFETHKLSMTTASMSRDLHCFSMNCQMVLAPYTSYNFSFRCNAATLTDALKYDKRSSYSNAIQWY